MGLGFSKPEEPEAAQRPPPGSAFGQSYAAGAATHCRVLGTEGSEGVALLCAMPRAMLCVWRCFKHHTV